MTIRQARCGEARLAFFPGPDSYGNHYGLVKAARGDEIGTLSADWEVYMSRVPAPAPHRGYRLSPVSRREGWVWRYGPL